MTRMTPLDTWFLHVEDEVDHMHIGSVGIFEGPPPPWSQLQDAISSRLHLVPRYRQRIRAVPLGVARPVWVDDPHFALEYHVRHTALVRPGGMAELRTLVGRVMGQQLDRRRPLWETWFVEGLAHDRWAMISKVHHCMVDGVAGTDALALVLRESPTPAETDTPAWHPEPEPHALRLVRDAAVELLTAPTEQWRLVRSATRRPRAAALGAVAAVRGASELLGLLRPPPPTSLTGSIGPHRRFAMAGGDLDDAKRVRRAFGGTVNDVVLAAIASGYRDLLAKRGELDDRSEIRTLVPVSLRTEAERGQFHNRVAAMFVPLPVAVADPLERYERMRDTMASMKGSGEQHATAALVGLSGIAPHMFVGFALRTATRLTHRVDQRLVTTVTTNVPGPQQPLFLAGRQMLAAYPFVPIAEGIRTGVAIFSYAGHLTFGITADYDTVADVEVLADGIERGLAELVELSAGSG
jgi:diacylglycerol O-acyltransferase / wax synthase